MGVYGKQNQISAILNIPCQCAIRGFDPLGELTEIIEKCQSSFAILHFRPRPHYIEEMCKSSFISTTRPTGHTSPSQRRSFSKTLFKPEEFENAGVLL